MWVNAQYSHRVQAKRSGNIDVAECESVYCPYGWLLTLDLPKYDVLPISSLIDFEE